MDVTCDRCSTAYEFDDALVSERGTTVKCTNCGHQFKVRRATSSTAPERWLVRTIDGRELEFRALRELQGAIAQAQISREDVLSRGGSRPRRLGSIAELEPFFASVGFSAGRGTSPGIGNTPQGYPRGRSTTPQGLGAVNNLPSLQRTEGSVVIPLPKTPPARTPLPPPADLDLNDETVVMPGKGPFGPSLPHATLTMGSPAGAVGAPRPRSVPPPPIPQASLQAALPGVIVSAAGAPAPAAARLRKDAAPQIPAPAPMLDGTEDSSLEETYVKDSATLNLPLAAAASVEKAAPTPVHAPRVEIAPPPIRVIEPPSEPTPDEKKSDPIIEPKPSSSSIANLATPSEPSVSLHPSTPAPSMRPEMYPEDSFGDPPRRAGAARWIVGFVVAGLVALAFATVGRKYLVPTAPVVASAAPDGRIGALLQEGEKSLLEGDLESAKEQFDKASALGERDPRVALDLARLAVVRGDIAWLRLRLLPDNDPDEASAKRELEDVAQRARKAADRAAELAPNDATGIRARIDALRLAGDLAGARRLVSGISAASSQPENALALAELDLAEAKPDWATVIGRLRAAQSADQNLGRARAMLVYALARSGDLPGAREELDRLAALPRATAMVKPLRAFLAREAGAAADAGATAAASASAKPGAAPVQGALGVQPGSGAKPDDRVPDDYVAPSGTIDTSDLPGVKHAPPPTTGAPLLVPTQKPTSPTPAPTPQSPPGVDTSDLPGFK